MRSLLYRGAHGEENVTDIGFLCEPDEPWPVRNLMKVSDARCVGIVVSDEAFVKHESLCLTQAQGL